MTDAEAQNFGSDANLVDDTPLEPEEIEEAEQRIAELHPLRDLPLYRVFPIWAPVIKYCSRKANSKRASPEEKRKAEYKRLKEAGKSMGVAEEPAEPLLGDAPQEEFPEDENPYLSLGFGMVAYYTMLRTLIYMFIVFTFLMIPVITTYSSYDGLKSGNNYSKTKYSLGNMGFTEHICKHQFFQISGMQNIQCRTGTIAKMKQVGILPY